MSTSRGHRLDTLQARRILGGVSIAEVARRANLTDELIQRIEGGDSCDPHVTQRILDALAPPVSLASNTQANPTVFTVTASHQFQTGDTVVIAGNTGSKTASISKASATCEISATVLPTVLAWVAFRPAKKILVELLSI